MKKFLSYILILVVVVGVLFPTTSAHAAFGFGWDDVAGLFARVAYLLMSISARLLGIAGLLLDFVIKQTIVDMKVNLAKISGINTAWKVIRDLMNIGFIFLLVYEGISMIIGQSTVEKVKKFIVAIVMTSLLMNFSLFFTKILIDASNLVTIGFYNSLTTDSTTVVTSGYTSTVKGLTASYMNALGLGSFYSGKSFDQITTNNQDKLVFFALGNVIFLIVTFVFFAISIMFVVRYVTLLILLMLSPIAFTVGAIPGVSSYSKTWWSSLKGQLLFPPIYMIMTWVILTLISSMIKGGVLVQTDAWGNIMTNSSTDTNGLSLVFNFAVIIGLTVFSLIIAKQTASEGAKQIGAMTGKLTAFAGGAVMGGAARFGRGTIGRAGNAIASNENLKNAAARGGVGGWFAKQTLKGGDKTAKSSFDVRSTSGFDNLAKETGVSFGKGADAKKVNFKKGLEAQATKEKETAKLLEQSEYTKLRAEEKLKGGGFVEREAVKLKQHLESEEYKNSDVYKNARKAEVGKKDFEEKKKTLGIKQGGIKTKEKEIADLEEKKKTALTGADITAIEKQVQGKKEEVEVLKKEVETDKVAVDALGKTQQENDKAIETEKAHEESWMSQEKKDLTAQKGGQKGGVNKETGKTQQEVENVYHKRVKAYAGTFSNESGIKRWTKNLAKTGAMVGAGSLAGLAGAAVGGAGGSTVVRTKADNSEIAKAILSLAKGKTTEQKTKDLLKDLKKEAEAKGETWEEEGDKEKAEPKKEAEKENKPEETPKAA